MIYEMRMRRLASIIIPLFLAAAIATPFTACEKYILPAVELSSDTLYFSAKADSAQIRLTTNVTVRLDGDFAWISVSPQTFEADTAVTVRVLENNGTEARSETLPFRSESIERKLVVIQDGNGLPAPEPEGSEGPEEPEE